MDSENNIVYGIFGFILSIYFLISQVMTILFFIAYCRTDSSLLKIIFIDGILSELKGLLWILFI